MTTHTALGLAATLIAAAAAHELAPVMPVAFQGPARLYSAASPWNVPLTANASIDPESDAMVQTVVDAAHEQGFLIAVKKWSWPIYYADDMTPRYTIPLTAYWASGSALTGVPIPPGAAPDPSDDGHLAVIDRSTGCEYDLWRAARLPDGMWTAAWANGTDANDSGWFPDGGSATGSGATGAAGVIRPEELRAGVIHHALAFAYPYTKAGGPVLPATESDGRSTVSGAIPEGAHLRLDPKFNLASLELKPYERIIATAMQTYGLFLVDSGGGVALVAQNPQSSTVPYPWGDETYVYLPQQLLPHLRVLTLPPQYRRQNRLVPSRCGTFVSVNE
jgi:hypothetical protein